MGRATLAPTGRPAETACPPSTPTYLTVLRQAFSRAAHGEQLQLYFGATSGDLFGSGDAGATWTTVATRLPPVFSVIASLSAALANRDLAAARSAASRLSPRGDRGSLWANPIARRGTDRARSRDWSVANPIARRAPARGRKRSPRSGQADARVWAIATAAPARWWREATTESRRAAGRDRLAKGEAWRRGAVRASSCVRIHAKPQAPRDPTGVDLRACAGLG